MVLRRISNLLSAFKRDSKKSQWIIEENISIDSDKIKVMAMETLPDPFAISNTDLLSPAISSAERMEKNICTALVLKAHTWVPLISFLFLVAIRIAPYSQRTDYQKTFLQTGVHFPTTNAWQIYSNLWMYQFSYRRNSLSSFISARIYSPFLTGEAKKKNTGFFKICFIAE